MTIGTDDAWRGPLSYLSFAAQNQNVARSSTITGSAGHLHGDDEALVVALSPPAVAT